MWDLTSNNCRHVISNCECKIWICHLGPSCLHTAVIYVSIDSKHPHLTPQATPSIIWTTENWFVQIPVPFSQNCVQMPYQVPDLMETTMLLWSNQSHRYCLLTLNVLEGIASNFSHVIILDSFIKVMRMNEIITTWILLERTMRNVLRTVWRMWILIIRCWGLSYLLTCSIIGTGCRRHHNNFVRNFL